MTHYHITRTLYDGKTYQTTDNAYSSRELALMQAPPSRRKELKTSNYSERDGGRDYMQISKCSHAGCLYCDA